jgi:hypothetical protein
MNWMFVAWARRGVASAITEADPASGPWLKPATFSPSLLLKKDGAALPESFGPKDPLPLLGPGAVVGLTSKSVLRTDPRDGATNVEDNYLALVEFSRADLPWMFTPATHNDKNRLRPWLVLIVVDAATVQLQPGTPVPFISVNDADLPDLNDSWAWAHAQVTVDDRDKADAELARASGTSAISRLLCPRRLKADKTYLACVVPATRAGARAGLGKLPDPGPAIAQAWVAGAGQDVTLPVYYSWRFSTAADGDFKSLVKRLHGVRATDVTGFGGRTVDISTPWQQGEPEEGATFGLGGALAVADVVDDPLANPALANFLPRLTKLLDFPADQLPADAALDPTLSAIAPPIYAGRHAGAARVPVDGWLRTLNLDPARRIAASFGTTYVQENQEFLMAQAWNQLGAVQQANRLQALAELAAEVGDRMHQRHLASLDLSTMVSIAAPARTRVLVPQPDKPAVTMTLHATTKDSPMPAGTATVAFNRFTRAQGPLGRRTFNGMRPTTVVLGLTGRLNIAPIGQDGLASLTPPLQAQAASDATIGLALRGWQQVTTLEAATQATAISPTTFLTLVKATAAAKSVATPQQPKFGLPIVLNFQTLSIAKPQDIVGPLRLSLATSLLPSAGIFKRFQGRVQIPDRLGAGKARVMACPQFTAPLAIALITAHPDWLVPGLGNFPDDSVTLVHADGAFVEAFLAGANHEMNREFLWRGYPTDQRGTPFQYFWPRPDRVPDIPPITNWSPLTALGNNGVRDGKHVEDLMVFLVRGELVHRYPRLFVYAVRGKLDGQIPKPDDDFLQWQPPAFAMKLDNRTTAFAFDLKEEEVRGKPGYYFMFSEPVTGPRFNFDVTPANPMKIWSDLDWDRAPQDKRGFAFAGKTFAGPLPQDTGGARWDGDAADMASIAFARPFRVAYHADELLPAQGV